MASPDRSPRRGATPRMRDPGEQVRWQLVLSLLAQHDERLASVETFVRQALEGPAALRELMERANADSGHLRLVRGMTTLRGTIVQRLSDELASLAETEDPYCRLDALGGFRTAVGLAVTKARAGGLRPLGKALMMVRDALSQLRAEELQDRHLAVLQGVLSRLASRDPSRDDLVDIDRELVEVGLDWVPVVPVQEEDR